ncbi:MAG: DUF378 domain-containing protein [Candidatus Saccharimonadales bacterium]
MNKGVVSTIALVLVVIGGLNWGLVGFFEYNLVDELFTEGSGLARTVYALVGLSALYVLFTGVFAKNSDNASV